MDRISDRRVLSMYVNMVAGILRTNAAVHEAAECIIDVLFGLALCIMATGLMIGVFLLNTGIWIVWKLTGALRSVI